MRWKKYCHGQIYRGSGLPEDCCRPQEFGLTMGPIKRLFQLPHPRVCIYEQSRYWLPINSFGSHSWYLTLGVEENNILKMSYNVNYPRILDQAKRNRSVCVVCVCIYIYVFLDGSSLQNGDR